MMDDYLLPRYQAKAAFEHRDFPLPKHAWARSAAIAARFFAETRPELGVKFRRHIMQNQAGVTPENFGQRLAEFAAANGVDPSKAAAASQDQRYARLVDQDLQEGVARGVRRTPTVFVDGQPFVETFAVEEISKAIDAALAAAKP
jgi:protein-disulfide isomerase